MKKDARILISLLFLFLSSTCFSDINENNNNIFLEALGSAGMYSINYERMVFDIDNIGRIGLRIGLSFHPGKNLSVNIPIMVTMVIGSSHMLEVGVGIDPLLNFGDNFQMKPVFLSSIGYRYSPIDGGLGFRAALTPVFTKTNLPEMTWMWGGLSLGWIF